MSKKPSPNITNDALIKIGCDPKAVQEARAAINDILASPAADAAKVKALETLNGLCGVTGVTISNRHLSSGPQS